MPLIIKPTPSQRFGLTRSLSNQADASKINTLFALAIGPATFSGVMDKNANQIIASHNMHSAPSMSMFELITRLVLAQSLRQPVNVDSAMPFIPCLNSILPAVSNAMAMANKIKALALSSIYASTNIN